ncbi:MAG: response regulator [Methylomarinum sp.]|nr:response regulator [Methylomarinum sp.]
MAGSNKQTVLIVDDTPENIDILVGILKDDYEVFAALNGLAAIKLIQSGKLPDIILLDVMMPKMDGYQVCEILKKDYTTRHIPVIFVTAKVEIADELKGFALGAADYIFKPFSPPVIKAHIKTHLALCNQNRELERKVVQRTVQLNETRLQVVQRLGRAAEYKDNETGMHVLRMSHYSHVLGLAAGMNEEEADLLLNAAPMHDVGKIGIPDRIILKPGKLDADEWVIMKTHCEIGAKIIGDDSCELLEMAKLVALTHHERWDGTGYPKGLNAGEIPRVGRIVAIADVFDALTSKRPYKEAWPIEDAIEMIKKDAGTHFDPYLVSLFINVLPELLKIKERYFDT